MENKFEKFIDGQLSSLELLQKDGHYTSAKMVFYATIDILGYVTGKKFDGFVRSYIDIDSLGVKASDLWGARNAILHTNTPNSDLSNEGKARQISYAFGSAPVNFLKEIISRMRNKDMHVAVSFPVLVDKLKLGIEMLKIEMKTNQHLEKMVIEKTEPFYVIRKVE